MSDPYRIISFGARDPNGTWRTISVENGRIERKDNGIHSISFEAAADAVEIVLSAPEIAQFLGAGERFDALDLRGSSVRYYLENFALGSGTYLPVPWIATTAGFSLFLDGPQSAVFHLAAPWDPRTIRIQVEGGRLDLQIHLGTLKEQYAALIERIGPPLLPNESFFGLWKAGDWRFENAETIEADRRGFEALNLPMAVKLIDAYWEDEVHSFAFDERKYPDAWGMVERFKREGTEVHLWLCPWVVVGTRSFEYAKENGYTIKDMAGQLITRRPGANPNVVAALIDFSNPAACDWWASNLRDLVDKGIAGFKADFGEQLSEHAVLHSGETGGAAHNNFVRYYLEATMRAFGDRNPAIISRSGSPKVRTQIWSGDQTSDFCPKTGLPAAIRAAQSASLSGWSFVGSDLGGYFGTPTPQVFARWTQFACFTPLMQLHGLGCREPWDMDQQSVDIFRRYAELHLRLAPYLEHHAHIAAEGGDPMIRMMPLAFPDVDWRTINDWDQQFMLGDALLVAPAAFYANTRAVYLPAGRWFDVMASSWAEGDRWIVRDTPVDQIPVFVRAGSCLYLRKSREGRDVLAVIAQSARGRADSQMIAPRSVDRNAPWNIAQTALLGTPIEDNASEGEIIEDEWLSRLHVLPIAKGTHSPQ